MDSVASIDTTFTIQEDPPYLYILSIHLSGKCVLEGPHSTTAPHSLDMYACRMHMHVAESLLVSICSWP